MTGVELYVNGAKYEGWKSGSVTRSVEAAAGSFELSSVDKWERDKNPWRIFPGDKCVVKINGVTLITGYVDSVAPSLSSGEHSIGISGRDATCDIVDCSAIVPSFEIRGQTIGGLAVLLCEPFGIRVVDESGDKSVIPVAAVQPGETVFSCIEREARKKEVSITTDGAGALLLAKIGKERANDSLEQGKNVISASAEYDYSQRYSDYIVKAQASATGDSADAWNPPQNAVEARHKDANVKRYRPLVITAESESFYRGRLKSVEISGCSFHDCDFEKGTLNIERNYLRLEGKDFTLTPKTSYSKRTIKLPDYVVTELKDYLNHLYDVQPDTRIFTFSRYKLIRTMKTAGKKAGIKTAATPHTLRHGLAVLLEENGFPLTSISRQLGHGWYGTTLRYLHAPDKTQDRIAETLNTLAKDSNLE